MHENKEKDSVFETNKKSMFVVDNDSASFGIQKWKKLRIDTMFYAHAAHPLQI